MSKLRPLENYEDGCVAVGIAVLETLADGDEVVVVFPRRSGKRGWTICGREWADLAEFDPDEVEEPNYGD